MRYAMTSNGQFAAYAALLRFRAQNPRPLTLQVGAYLERAAQRRAPRGRSRRQQSLSASLNMTYPDDRTGVLRSDKKYATIQNQGGTILAGSGPLGSKLLAIPLNDTARRLIDSLGTHTSLRDVPGLTLLRTRRGRLVLIQSTPTPTRNTGHKRQHRIFSGQVLFLLVPRVTLRANPSPRGFAPRLDEPPIATWITERARKYLTAVVG